MTGEKRARKQGQQKKSVSSHKAPRQKEQAEIDRVKKAVQIIPRYSNRFILFRKNRRQKAKQIAEEEDSQVANQHPIFSATRFTDLPLSARTLDGLAVAGFSELTPIQRVAVPQALAGRDALAAAPTGSGKTLSFLIPMLEILWREKWNPMDGLGALVLSPTRELSMQIFDVLRKVARQHTISAGLVIGGKDLENEREKVGVMNVLVGTPGRVLHHMDQVADFDCSNLKVLVLDEADRILDMGFSKTLDAIMLNLPSDRQTLLFSATQTKDIKALARLSLKSPEYMSVTSMPKGESAEKNGEKDAERTDTMQKDDENDAGGDENATSGVKIVGTPVGLSQSYAVVKLQDKLSVLWSFMKTHLKSKMIIFLSSGKQVRFVFETFCKLRPGMSLLHIHGNMKQTRRTEMYNAFCKSKSSALFATDVASRGLDFPDVEWVVQVDCPDDVGTYVHRVGRTARFKAHGRAMLLLSEGKEESFLKKLEAKKLSLQRSKINPNRMSSIDAKISAVIASNQELRSLAQRAFLFYVKSIYQKSDKDVFDVEGIDFAALAKSFGLSVTPKVTFKGNRDKLGSASNAKLKTQTVFGYDIRRMQKRKKRDADDDDDKIEADDLEEKRKTSKRKSRGEDSGDEDNDDEDILTLKRTHVAEDDGDSAADAVPVERKRKKRKLDLLKGMASANRIVFDEDGHGVRASEMKAAGEDDIVEQYEGIEDYAASVSRRLAEGAIEDKERERERIKSMHAKQRRKEKDLNRKLRPSAEAETDQVSAAIGGDVHDDDSSEDKAHADDDSDDEGLDAKEQLALEILQSRSKS